MNLIVTARDPATAVSFDKLLPVLAKHPQFQLRVLCQHPAYDILAITQSSASFDLIEVNNDEFRVTLEDDFIREQFSDFQPDAVLTGISGPDTGIDEAVLHYARQRSIQSYALQSFWGDINQKARAIPDTAFVLDEEAARVTEQRYPQIRSVPIGSIKHMDYCHYAPLPERQQKRPGLVKTEEVLVGFYGQPIPDIPGYLETIQGLARQLRHWDRAFKVMVRPHPKESSVLRVQTLAMLRAELGTERVVTDPFDDIKDSLVVCDLVTSAFSTCGFDNLYLNEIAPQAFSTSVYLWFQPELIQWWRAYSQLERMPLIEEGLLLAVEKEEQMLKVFEEGLKPSTQAELRRRATRKLPRPQDAIDCIIDTCLRDYHRT
ncbi:hypothetical protein [Thiomicrospira sp. WB1]|uniref:hypothetical protein n=1 Tax=Thiomicrospira sp. WB1 TaxID=1685380 RepID=UPI000838A45A|nr:hypothetical protein [Thiomicrospira sp. WB1]